MNVGRGVGHSRVTHREEISRVVAGDESVHLAVVGRGRLGPQSHSTALTRISLQLTAGRHIHDHRGLFIQHRHIETGAEGVAVNISGRVGDLGRTHQERVTRKVRRGAAVDLAVVDRQGINPGDDCGAQPRLGVQGDVSRHVFERGVLVVGDGHKELLGAEVSVNVDGCVGHHIHTDFEEAATGLARLEGTDGTVVSSIRLGPGHQGSAITQIVGKGNAVRNVGDHGALIVGDGHRKAVVGTVAMNISHGQAHRRFTDRELVTGLVAQGDSRNATVVLCLRRTPFDDGTAIAEVIVD